MSGDGAPEFAAEDDFSIAEDDEPDWDCVARMSGVDTATPEMRRLIYEFGLQPVARFAPDVCRSLSEPTRNELVQLGMALKSWRFQRQQEWLSTDYVTAKDGMGMLDVAAIRKRAAGLR